MCGHFSEVHFLIVFLKEVSEELCFISHVLFPSFISHFYNVDKLQLPSRLISLTYTVIKEILY